MKQSKILTSLLVLSGLSGVVVGVGMLFFPIGFHATSGIKIAGGVNLMNEMRAAGGLLMVGGGYIFAGAFVRALTFTSTLVAIAMYLSYGFFSLNQHCSRRHTQ